MSKVNYHTHTSRCHHADGTDEEYIQSAIRGGYQVLGFSDHTPWPYESGFISPTRMLPEQLEEYVNQMRELRDKYKEQIDIKIGLECENYPAYIPWLKEQIEKYQLDYVLLGNHHYPSDEVSEFFGIHCPDPKTLSTYEKSVIEGMQSGIYAYLAHPDLFMSSRSVFDDDCIKISRHICQEANRLNMAIEYNLGCAAYCEESGETLFPHPMFWEIAAEEGCTAIIGIDAHSPYMLETSRYFDAALETLKTLGIKTTTEIPLRTY